MSNGNANWSSRSIGSKAGHQVFYYLVRMGGIKLAYALLFFVVVFYTCLPSVRKRSAPYISRRFAGQGAIARFVTCFRLNMSFGMVLLDRIIFGIVGRGSTTAMQEDDAAIRAALQAKKGLIVLSGHVGAWQTGMAGLAFAGVPINVVLLQESGNVDLHFFEHGTQGPPVHAIDPSGPFGGMVEMQAALRRNEIVCVMGDRYLPGDKNTVDVSFFKEPVCMPLFPYMMAASTGAHIAVMATLREGACKNRGHVLDVFSVPATLRKNKEECRKYAQRFATSIERVAWMCPFQFFNFFDMWRK